MSEARAELASDGLGEDGPAAEALRERQGLDPRLPQLRRLQHRLLLDQSQSMLCSSHHPLLPVGPNLIADRRFDRFYVEIATGAWCF